MLVVVAGCGSRVAMSAFPDTAGPRAHERIHRTSNSVVLTSVSLLDYSYSCYGIYGYVQLFSDDKPIR